MARGASWLAWAALLLLVPVPVPAAPPPPITGGATGTAQEFASPHEMAFSAVQRLITDDARISNDGTFFTRDQMLGVLVYVHRSLLFPSRAGIFLDEAQRLWGAAEVAYNVAAKSYDSTLTARAVCVDTEANAWALQASDQLANATGRADVRTRASDLSQTLSSALSGGSVNGVSLCPQSLTPSAAPLPIWSLLLHYEATRDTASRTAALSELDDQIAQHYDRGMRDVGGIYLAISNAQFLLALQAAERMSPTKYKDRRDEVATLLTDKLAQPEGPGLLLYNAERQGDDFVPKGDVDSLAQSWGAYALHGQRSAGALPVADAPERILDALIDHSWSTVVGGLVAETGRLHATANLLVVLFTAGPSLTQVNAEGARVAFVVPARRAFPYPDAAQASADDYLVSNEWTFRFTLEPNGPANQPVMLPLSLVGPVRHVLPQSAYAPLPQLQRAGGVQVQVTAEGGAFPFLRFKAQLQPVTPYRLVDYAPVLPIASELQRDLRLFLTTNTTEAIRLDLLRLDIAVSNVTIDAVRFNDQLLSATDYTPSQISATEQLGFPHVRLEIRGIELRPSTSNEVFVSYTDLEAPTIEPLVVSTDLGGSNRLEGSEGNAYKVSTRGSTYVATRVTDNAALKSVSLVVSLGVDNVSEIPMLASPADPDRHWALLPVLPARRDAQVFVQAVDEHGSLRRSETLTVHAEPPFLQKGNPVLLVFSAVLFVGAIVVWSKMGRRRRRA